MDVCYSLSRLVYLLRGLRLFGFNFQILHLDGFDFAINALDFKRVRNLHLIGTIFVASPICIFSFYVVSSLVLSIEDAFAANIGNNRRRNRKFKVIFVFRRWPTFSQR